MTGKNYQFKNKKFKLITQKVLIHLPRKSIKITNAINAAERPKWVTEKNSQGNRHMKFL